LVVVDELELAEVGALGAAAEKALEGAAVGELGWRRTLATAGRRGRHNTV